MFQTRFLETDCKYLRLNGESQGLNRKKFKKQA